MIVTIGLIYFDVISLDGADDAVKDMVNEQVQKGTQSFNEYKEETIEKFKDMKK